MGQCKWALACALAIAAFGLESTSLNAQEAEQNPFADDGVPTEHLGAEVGHNPDLAERRIEFILDQPLQSTLQYAQTPLNTITSSLANEYGIPIVFDTAALEAIAVSPDVEVDVNLANLTLRSALDLMFKQVEDVTYLIDDEVLLITTTDVAESRLEVRVYRVDDLVYDVAADGARSLDEDRFDDLLDIIISTVEHDSWMENGTGEGDIYKFAPGMFVVSQTRRVHDQIARVLIEIRDVKAEIEAASPASSITQRPVTRGFVVSGKDFTEAEGSRASLRNAILRSVPWSVDGADLGEDEVFLEVLPNRVLVRHLPGVVRDVERVLEKCGASPRAASPGPGMGFSRVEDRKATGRGGF